MKAVTDDEKRDVLEAVIEKMDEIAELLRSLDNDRIKAYCLAAFEGSGHGWLGTFERDIIEQELRALDDDEDEECTHTEIDARLGLCEHDR
jgi:hypothetical protein